VEAEVYSVNTESWSFV